MEIKLTDGTWIEGEPDVKTPEQVKRVGVALFNAHHSVKGGSVPLGKQIFVPYSNILFIVVEG